MKSNALLKVLGSAQDGGVPQPGCYCKNCEEARKDPLKQRFAVSLGLLFPKTQNWYLFDAGPDFKAQVNMVHQSFNYPYYLAGIFLTHAHIGHYTGLIYTGKEAMATQSLPVYAAERLKKFLTNNQPWKQLIELKNIKPILLESNTVKTVQDIKIIPIEVPHRSEHSETMGFFIEGPNTKVLYIPDIDGWKDWQYSIVEIAADVDYCLIDGTFYSESELIDLGRNIEDIPHPFITETMDLLQNNVNNKMCDVYFLHFNHTNSVLNSNSSARSSLHERGFNLVQEGLEITL